MDLDTVSEIVDGDPHMDRRRGRQVYDYIVSNGLSDVLELGTCHGVSTCDSDAAVHGRGTGHVTTVNGSLRRCLQA